MEFASVSFTGGSLKFWLETYSTSTQSSVLFTPKVSAANVNAVIAPKGAGSLLVRTPDGTATGGNARGDNAVDLQAARSVATQVASGNYSVIGGGIANSAVQQYHVICGGTNNTTQVGGDGQTICGGGYNLTAGTWTFIGGGSSNNSGGNYSVIVGGYDHTITGTIGGAYSFIGGGDTHSIGGTYSTIVGGQQNNTGGASAAFIGGGFSNYGFNNYFVICGGYDNTNGGASAFVGGGQSNNLTSGSYATLVGGDSNYLNGNWGFLGGGYQNRLNEQFTSIIGGRQANATLYGMQAHSSGQFSVVGDAQRGVLQMRRAITGTTISELFLDGSSVRAILPATNCLWMAQVQLVAICTAAGNGTTVVGDSYVTERHAGIKRLNTTTSLVGSVQTIGTAQSDASMSTSVVTITADDTNEALKVEFTPPSTAGSTTTFRVVATIHLTQVQY